MSNSYKTPDDGFSQEVNEPSLIYGRNMAMNIPNLLDDKFALIAQIKKGFSYITFDKIYMTLPYSLEEWSGLLGISLKSLHRYKSENRTFKPLQSEKIMEIAEVSILGQDVFGDNQMFTTWFSRPSQAFGGLSPKELVADSYGKQLVMDELYRIDHGIFA